MLLWLDSNSERDPSDEWRIVRKINEAIELLEKQEIDLVSIDYDLGEVYTGMDLCNWMDANRIFPKIINIHSKTRSRAEKMLYVLQHTAPRNSLILKEEFYIGVSEKLESFLKLRIKKCL
jgi:hypothetical protein